MYKCELLGDACFSHGPYTFYKAVRVNHSQILQLGSFFLTKLWNDADLVSIGELQLLWIDNRGPDTPLASLRLYFLPENTPDGRTDNHGEDEVLTISDKVVVRVHDLVTWLSPSLEWSFGRKFPLPEWSSMSVTTSSLHGLPDSVFGRCSDVNIYQGASHEPGITIKASKKTERKTGSNHSINDACKNIIGNNEAYQTKVVVLSYARYCRYRSLIRRVEDCDSAWLYSPIVASLSGFKTSPGTRVLFCRDTFDYPDLETHELLCNHLAPKLKGRPRRKRKKRGFSPNESSNESETSVTSSTTISSSSRTLQSRMFDRTTYSDNHRSLEERQFTDDFHNFMTSLGTPLAKIPLLGYRRIDLFLFYTKVQELGGYEKVNINRLWKSIFNELGGNANWTKAAAVTRRCYEKLLLPYERCQRNEHMKLKKSKVLTSDCTSDLSSTDIANESYNDLTSLSSSTLEKSISQPMTVFKEKSNSMLVMSTCFKSVNSPTSNIIKTNTTRPEDNMKEMRSEYEQTNVFLARGKMPDEWKASKVSSSEVIDLERDDDESRHKLIIPSAKNRKLEILKEGGLEVMAIDLNSQMISCCPQSFSSISNDTSPQTSPAPLNNSEFDDESHCDVTSILPIVPKLISVTVTPDISHILEPKNDHNNVDQESPVVECPASTTSCILLDDNIKILRDAPIHLDVLNNLNFLHLHENANFTISKNSYSQSSVFPSLEVFPPPKATQSRSMFSTNVKTVYGNPKEIVEASKYVCASLDSHHSISRNLRLPHSISLLPAKSDGVFDLTGKIVEGTNRNQPMVNRPHLEIVKVPIIPRPKPTHLRACNSKNDPLPVMSTRKTQYSNIMHQRKMTGDNLEVTLVRPTNESGTPKISVSPRCVVDDSLTVACSRQTKWQMDENYPTKSKFTSLSTLGKQYDHQLIPKVPNLNYCSSNIESIPKQIHSETMIDERRPSDFVSLGKYDKKIVGGDEYVNSSSLLEELKPSHERLKKHSNDGQNSNHRLRRHSVPILSSGSIPNLLQNSPGSSATQLSNDTRGKCLPQIFDPAHYMYNGLFPSAMLPTTMRPLLPPELSSYYEKILSSTTRARIHMTGSLQQSDVPIPKP